MEKHKTQYNYREQELICLYKIITKKMSLRSSETSFIARNELYSMFSIYSSILEKVYIEYYHWLWSKNMYIVNEYLWL